ncbi:MAG TPA: hypothetical protein VKB08_09070, partial [Bradyrhizobium sp.]|nr:hypothetical protein [Bradyrhizobium sp.]
MARHFRAADTQNEDYPTVQALQYMGWLIAERSGGRHHEPFDTAMAGVGSKRPGDRGADRTNSQGGVSWPQPRNRTDQWNGRRASPF